MATKHASLLSEALADKGLSLLGYHLCNYSVTKNVFKMVAYQKSYEKNTLCGGWIPWMVCPKTYHKTKYRTIEVPETVNFTDCCEGYEQVGLYCTLSLNRSSEFASRPGICPKEDMETSNYSCTFDTDCPGLKKCCNSSIGAGCVTPLPGVTERNLRKYWFNASVLVKMDFNELHRIDPRLLNHSRLLHALTTGALQPFHSSVYHIQTAHTDTYSGTVISHILIGLYEPASLMKISSLLKGIMRRVYEVIDIDVQDVNECSYAELNACPRKELCRNMEGFYSCTCEHEHVDTNSSHLSGGCKDMIESTPRSALDPVSTSNSSVSLDNSTIVLPKSENSTDSECYSSAIRNHRIFSVTSNGFEVSWSVNSTLNHTFQVEVFKGKDIFKSIATTEMRVDVSDLEAGIMYLVKISYETCGKTIISQQSAKTNAQIFGIIIRILNYNLTEQLHNTSSLEYQEFSRLLLTEIGNSFPPNISTLYTTGKLKVQIESLKAGSILVRLRVIIQDSEFSTDTSSFAPVLSYLYKGSVFLVDQQSSSVGDWDECAFPSENDCSMYAECINSVGSYRCRCKTTMDTNPSRPGRNCEGEIVNPMTATMPPGTSRITDIPPETSTALYTSPANTEMKTNFPLHSNTSTTLNVPLGLPSSGMQASDSHLSTQTPSVAWRRGMASSIGFGRNNSTMGMVRETTMGTPAMVTEQSKTVNVLIEKPMRETITGSPQHLATTTDASTGTAGQEHHNSPSSILSTTARNQTFRDRHAHLQLPEASSQDNSRTAFPTTENVGVHRLNSTADKAMGRENNTWSEKYLKESFSVSTTWPDLSPASNTMNFLTTDCIPAPAQRIILSNVNSTSFHAAWSTESTENLVFRFLLLQEDQLIWETKTRSRHLTVTGLELGVLYTVEIRTEDCMKESKSAHQKVKTAFNFAAAQKLNGTVRLTSMEYVQGFSNASSEEYQNFTRLFVNEVYKSMPLNLSKQMDNGTIKMSITSITNGSIVVGFSLVIAEDLDIQYIATAFRDAFQHSSYFTVDNNSFSIHDYDECKREEDDCSVEASCHNVYGSYQCSCNEGFIDLNSDRPGRNCKAFSPSGSPAATDDHPAGSTVFPVAHSLPWAHVSSLAAEESFATKPKVLEHVMFSSSAVPQASPDSMSNVYHSLPVTSLPSINSAQRLSIKDAVKIFCEIEKIVIAIQKKFLQQESIPESSLYLGEPHCNVSFRNDTSVVLQTGWNECGTEVQSNLTNTLVKTILRNDISLQGVIHHLKIVSPIHCVFQNDLLTSSGYTPDWVYTIFEDLHGSGHFITEMQLFVGNSAIPKNFSVSASDDILIEVGIHKEGSKLKVVLTECWATPSNNSVDPLSFAFINNSCPVPNTHTILIENGNSSKAQFKLKIFSFVNNSVVYLHCRIRICVETPESTCRTTCNGARSLKTGEIIATHRTSWGPLCKAAASDSKTRKEPGLGVGYIILIVITVFVFVLAVAAVLIFQYQRKTGRYNFRIKSDNFSYQVFYD
ncbi:PREDICTED: uromodulin-like 1 [Crocodylus porosus]|uniref:uromodulin-like 1 n=1 Tax=Crocodylus porosus TaxID=8502 RepID=UPI0009405E4B|nr:PREDICTED: uromodulin-like 1 [Crocodylus porosus]